MRTSSVITLVVASSIAVAHAADPALSRQQGDVFAKKVKAIAAHDAGRGARRTNVTETEVNSWFAYHSQPLLPSGVAEPSVTILGEGKVSGRATVDLDAVAKRQSTGRTLDPWSLIRGKVPLTVSGTLHTKDGVGRFELESAYVSTLPVPKFMLQELVSYYSRTPNNPDGLSLDDPFQLPANIRQIEVGKGQATIVQ